MAWHQSKESQQPMGALLRRQPNAGSAYELAHRRGQPTILVERENEPHIGNVCARVLSAEGAGGD